MSWRFSAGTSRRSASAYRLEMGVEFGVWGLGFGVCGLGFGVWGLGFGVWGAILTVLERSGGFRV